MDTGWEELERMAMAASAVDAQMSTQFPSADTIERWKQLFGYSQLEAARLINEQRGDRKYAPGVLPCIYQYQPVNSRSRAHQRRPLGTHQGREGKPGLRPRSLRAQPGYPQNVQGPERLHCCDWNRW
jgi:hypothetical protein